MLSGHAKDPTLFRSWSNADQDHTTVVQAAWATTRAPLFFNVVEHNNPVKYVVEEANSLFPGRPISCVLSLGTGTAEVIGLKQPDAFQNVLPQNLISLLKDIAEECERQSNTMETQLHQGDVPDFYFRLNVDEGLQSVSLAEWDILNEVSAHTLRYLEKPDVEQKVDWLLQIVKGTLENDLGYPTLINHNIFSQMNRGQRRLHIQLKKTLISFLPPCQNRHSSWYLSIGYRQHLQRTAILYLQPHRSHHQ